MRGRTTINLERYKAQIITWFQDENKTSDEIGQLLCETYDKPVAPRTVQCRLREWSVTKLKTLLDFGHVLLLFTLALI